MENMENEKLSISQEVLDNLSVEQLADLKVEIDDLMAEADSIIELCEETINS